MSWTNVSDNRWERPLDAWESYFSFVATTSATLAEGREHYTIFSKLKLELDLPDIESALRHAWKQVRYEQPMLATWVEGYTKVYEVPDDKALDEWFASTFVVSDASSFDSLEQSSQPVKQTTLYWLPQVSELAIRANHYNIDGVGQMLLWHSLLSALQSPRADIRFGDETARLAPTLDKVLGVPEELTEAQRDKAQALVMGYAGSAPGIGPPSKQGAAGSHPPGVCARQELTFTAAMTDALVKACKERNITVTTAVHAAYVQAVINQADADANKSKYVSVNEFSLRSYLPEPYNTSKYAVSVFYSPFPFEIYLPTSFNDIVESLSTYYATTFKKNPENLTIRSHLTRVLLGLVQTPEFAAAPIPSDALVSSIGIVERYMQCEYGSGIKVKDVELGVDVVMGMSMFFVYTFDDRLRLSYSFNDGFEDGDNIQKYLEEVHNILTKQFLS